MTLKKLDNWLDECYRITNITHMLLVCDRTADYEIFPVKVTVDEDPHEVAEFYRNEYGNVIEVYNMQLPKEAQVKSPVPVFNY